MVSTTIASFKNSKIKHKKLLILGLCLLVWVLLSQIPSSIRLNQFLGDSSDNYSSEKDAHKPVVIDDNGGGGDDDDETKTANTVDIQKSSSPAILERATWNEVGAPIPETSSITNKTAEVQNNYNAEEEVHFEKLSTLMEVHSTTTPAIDLDNENKKENNKNNLFLEILRQETTTNQTTKTIIRTEEDATKNENKATIHHHQQARNIVNHASSSSSSLLQPNSFSNSPASSSYACEWKSPPINLTDCHQLLTSHLQQGKYHRWYFIGDSTMRYLYRGVQSKLQELRQNYYSTTDSSVVVMGGEKEGVSHNNTNPKNSPPLPLPLTTHDVKKARGPCSGLEYFGFQRATEWILPNRSRYEGPLDVEKPFCTGAKTKNNRKEFNYDRNNMNYKTTSKKKFPNQSTTYQTELITVEYSLDVEFQTNDIRTTQELVALYLEREHQQFKYRHETVCVVNVGLHDAKLIQPYGLSPSIYATNVERYLTLIHPHCEVLIWIGISAVNSDSHTGYWPQKNEDLIPMNDAVNRWLDQYNKNNIKNHTQHHRHHEAKDELSNVVRPIFRIDVWNKTLTSPHADHLHLYPYDYYEPFGALLAQFLQPPPPS